MCSVIVTNFKQIQISPDEKGIETVLEALQLSFRELLFDSDFP